MTLKIQRSRVGDGVVFSLSGRIEAEHLAELERLLASEVDAGRVVLDLKEVRLVGRDVVSFLARQEAGGVRLENSPAYVSEWIVRERREAREDEKPDAHEEGSNRNE